MSTYKAKFSESAQEAWERAERWEVRRASYLKRGNAVATTAYVLMAVGALSAVIGLVGAFTSDGFIAVAVFGIMGVLAAFLTMDTSEHYQKMADLADEMWESEVALAEGWERLVDLV